MARRSLQASELGALAIKKALKQRKWTQTHLAGAAGCSRQTIWSLLQGNPVDCDVFMAVCNHLGLNWEEIAKSDQPEEPVETNDQIDALVQEARSRLQPYTQERCGMMRVLDMTQPIDLDNIYIQVNILQKLTRLKGSELAELLREGLLENFDRFCIGDVRQERVPGLEAVETFSKLMILGKPGAGKTTFLKHLAMQCIGGKFQSDRVPFFITLKEFAEAEGRPGVLEFCDRLLSGSASSLRSPLAPLKKGGTGTGGSEVPLLKGDLGGSLPIFQNRKALVLLDGLDEVREADAGRVLRQIQQFSSLHPGNQFVITCRIAAREYTFEQFTEVEVADFSPAQVAEFVGNWFNYKNDPVKAERFLEKLEEEEPIAELATSPLLLTLLCLVFEDSGSFPSNRAELYGTGVEVLLKKWDTKRNIDRQQVYKGLSLRRKEDLLSFVARSTFEAGNYFFKQREAERLIGEYIQNLPNADPAALEVDSGAVLKSIEAQHGLFVERARQIYSFSHLTFHEYFTARGIVEARDPAALQALATHVTEKRWREVCLRVTELLPNADGWLRMMKTEVDSLLAGDEKLQNFLRWVDEKAGLVQSSYKSSAKRAFYFNVQFASASHIYFDDQLLDLATALDYRFSDALDTDHDFEGKSNCDIILDRNLASSASFYEEYHALSLRAASLPDDHIKYVEHYDSDQQLASANELCRLEKEINEGLERILVGSLYIATCKSVKIALNCSLVILAEALFSFTKELPKIDLEEDSEVFKDWFYENGQIWTAQLRKVALEYRNIGHDWQFTEEQKQLLQQYYDANKLLVDCLNSECYLSRQVRQEIEDTLLLPISEIEKRAA